LRKNIYNIILVLTFIAIILFAFGILNTMVSLKYETDGLNDCISKITGINLCQTINYMKGLTFFFGVSFIGLLYYRKKIIK